MRNLKVKVKSAKGRTTASTRWLQRQLNDPFVKEARLQGLRSRSAFKLLEIDKKLNLLSISSNLNAERDLNPCSLASFTKGSLSCL